MIGSETTQDFVPIKEIHDGVVVLKDGSMRALLLVSSMNFGLKSAEEKEAIIFQYQNFLNSLDFDTQIFIQSRRLNIKPYLSVMEEKIKGQTNELLKVQAREYRDFIKTFTEQNDVMSKFFFVVIPYLPAIINVNNSFLSKYVPLASKDTEAKQETSWEENVAQLEQRIAVVENGLKRIGLRPERLGTEELVEVFFKLFNPGETEVPNTQGQ